MQLHKTTTPLILVIDDDPDLIDAITDTLELAGNYRVMSASDGVAGLETVAVAPPACIIVDVRMPQLNGLQFVRALRGDPNTAMIPMVMLSAMIQPQDELQGLFSGADAYLRKPVRVDELLATIQQALLRSEEQRLEQLQYLATTTEEPNHEG